MKGHFGAVDLQLHILQHLMHIPVGVDANTLQTPSRWEIFRQGRCETLAAVSLGWAVRRCRCILRVSEHGNGGGDMLQQLLADSRAAILGLLELAQPVIDEDVEFGERLFLLEDAFGREASHARRAQVAADAVVQAAPARAEGSGWCCGRFVAVVEAAELLGCVSMWAPEGGGSGVVGGRLDVLLPKHRHPEG